MRYIRKPAKVDAIRFKLNTIEPQPFEDFFGKTSFELFDAFLFVNCERHQLRVDAGEWIIRDESGRYFTCRDEEFSRTMSAENEL